MLWCEGIPSGGDYETPATAHHPHHGQLCTADVLTESVASGRCAGRAASAPRSLAGNRRRARARPRKHHRLSGRSRGKMPDGTTGYPETVLLRLLSSKGGPNIKIEIGRASCRERV